MRTSLQAPSIETQTIELLERLRAESTSRIVNLHCNGFRVTIMYEHEVPHGAHHAFNGLVTISNVWVPLRYRRRGWLTYYLKLCEQFAGDALFVESLYGPVRDALLRRGFVSLTPTTLALIKKAS